MTSAEAQSVAYPIPEHCRGCKESADVHSTRMYSWGNAPAALPALESADWVNIDLKAA